MKAKFILLFTLIVAACGSRNANECRISGKINHLTDSVVTLYGMFNSPDSLIHIPVTNGRFEYVLSLDTITPIYLYLESTGREYPLFADKKSKIHIEGDLKQSGDLSITGGNVQNEFDSWTKSFKSDSTTTELLNQADSFIVSHPHSVVSIYLIDSYFVRADTLDTGRIDRLVKSLSGSLRDHPYLKQLEEELKGRTPESNELYVPHFVLPDTVGKRVSTSQYKEEYLLLSFWASWHKESRDLQDSLKQLVKKFAKRSIKFVNVSLDTDREQWKEAIRRDTLSGIHLCDQKSWAGSLPGNANVSKLPANLLLNAHRRIILRDVWGDSLETTIENKLKAWEESQKRKKKK